MPRKKKPKQNSVIKRSELMKMGEVVRLGPERPAISFEFPMAPIPKGRPRSFIKGGRVVVTADPRSREYEQLIAQATAMQYEWSTPLEGDLIAVVYFYLKNRIHGDLDNLLKAILDGMQGVAFHNDKQIRGFSVEVYYFDELPSHDRIERTYVILSHRNRAKYPDAKTVIRDSEPVKECLSVENPTKFKVRGKIGTTKGKPAITLIDFGALTDEMEREAVEVFNKGTEFWNGLAKPYDGPAKKCPKCSTPSSTLCKCQLRRDDFRPDSGDALGVTD